MRNILKDGDANPVGEKLHDIRAEETLRQAAEAVGWGRTDKQPNVGRGLAIADQLQGAGQSTASVTIDASGQVNLYMSLWDTGTGAHTIMRQIVAEMLTLPTQQVRLVMQDTDAVPYESGPGGTRVTYTSGQAAFGAAKDLRDKLLAVAASCWKDRWRASNSPRDDSYWLATRHAPSPWLRSWRKPSPARGALCVAT